MNDIEQSPSIRCIKEIVSDEFGYSTLLLVSDRRSHKLTLARHVAIALCCELTPFSLPALGQQFGNRDHTTIMYAKTRIEKMCVDDTGFAIHFQSLLMRCRELIIRQEHIESVAAICTGSIETVHRQLDSRLRVIQHRLISAAKKDPERVLHRLEVLSKHLSFADQKTVITNPTEKETVR